MSLQKSRQKECKKEAEEEVVSCENVPSGNVRSDTHEDSPTRMPKNDPNGDKTNRLAHREGGKPRRPQSLIKNYRQLKNAQIGRNSFPREEQTSGYLMSNGQL